MANFFHVYPDLVRPARNRLDLLHNTIRDLEANIEKVVIDKLEGEIFHAKLIITTNTGHTKVIDCRPSDSIALAVRAHAPIFVEEEIIRQSETLNKNNIV